MIDAKYIQTMASYNKWQNTSIYNAADELGDEERCLERGAFFGSIHKTLCHLLWADMIWLSRFADFDEPEVTSIAGSSQMVGSWRELQDRRLLLDLLIVKWADNLPSGFGEGEFSWFSGALNSNVTRPMCEVLVHFFNHQTHHRGQVHAMITAAGGRPDDTDLIVMSMR